jgi:hypothetical protein
MTLKIGFARPGKLWYNVDDRYRMNKVTAYTENLMIFARSPSIVARATRTAPPISANDAPTRWLMLLNFSP